MIEQVLAWGNMCEAWQQVEAAKSAPGVDEVTVKRWARNWETNLHRLIDQVRTNTYHPNRPRRFKVAKKDGTYRELSILTVTDRVMQRAVLNVVNPLFDVRFLDCSHGYRANRSVATAVNQVLCWRDKGLRWVVDADIASCFDSLDHEVLMSLLQRVVKDAVLLNVMGLWLKVGAKKKNSKSQNPNIQNPKIQNSNVPNPKFVVSEAEPSETANLKSVGVPLGAVISPLWCNVYLHQLDARLITTGWHLVRYADDFVVMTQTEAEAQRVMKATQHILNDLRLELSARKTRIVSFDEGFDFLGVTFYRDTYSYTWEQKRIEVQGRNVRWLYRHLPKFY